MVMARQTWLRAGNAPFIKMRFMENPQKRKRKKRDYIFNSMQDEDVYELIKTGPADND